MKRLIFVILGIGVVSASGAIAQVPEAEWKQFKAQFALMTERVAALEIENQQLRAITSTTLIEEDLEATNAEVAALQKSTSKMSWSERIKWKGDYRFRYEAIDEEGKDD
ncbi:MAG: hypothetical protein P8J79_12220, partial [Halioglobus sp.]|nr:hypothetical protein [Halioglobus sp.]